MIYEIFRTGARATYLPSWGRDEASREARQVTKRTSHQTSYAQLHLPRKGSLRQKAKPRLFSSYSESLPSRPSQHRLLFQLHLFQGLLLALQLVMRKPQRFPLIDTASFRLNYFFATSRVTLNNRTTRCTPTGTHQVFVPYVPRRLGTGC